MDTLFLWLLEGVVVTVLEFGVPINLALSFATALLLSLWIPISSSFGFVAAVAEFNLTWYWKSFSCMILWYSRIIGSCPVILCLNVGHNCAIVCKGLSLPAAFWSKLEPSVFWLYLSCLTEPLHSKRKSKVNLERGLARKVTYSVLVG